MNGGYEERLLAVVRASPILSDVLARAETFGLPDWWIVSGAVYNTVWNQLTGRPDGYGIKDIDLFYFDPDTAYAAEDAQINRARGHFADRPPVEVRNQARVHLWYRDHFGHDYPKLNTTTDGIDHFACRTHCVGLRQRDGLIDIYAPYGLADIFNMRITPNPILPNRATHEAKAARQKRLWPELEIIPWPEEDRPKTGESS